MYLAWVLLLHSHDLLAVLHSSVGTYAQHELVDLGEIELFEAINCTVVRLK